MPTVRGLLQNWRVKLSAVVIVLNLELVVIPWILIWLFELSGPALRNAAGSWATVEMCWWVYFSGWASREAGKLQQVVGVREATSEFVEEVKEDTVVKIEEFIEDHTFRKFDLERLKGSRPYIFSVRIIKAFGYTFGFLFVFFLSAIPFPGVWIPGLAFCRKNNWTFGYFALFTGNFMKNYFYAYVWEFLWPYRPYMLGGLFLVGALVLIYKYYRGLTWKDMLFNGLAYFSKTPKNHP